MTVEAFCMRLVRMRLVPAESARQLAQRWHAVARDPRDVASFTRWLIANQHLTEYQAARLGRDTADGLFVGSFAVLERIGKGQTAGVYKARGTQGQIVAIKVLPPSKAKDPEVLARFQREARLAQQLDHPGVVKTLEIGISSGLNYLIMEYLQGETLDALLGQRKALPPLEAVRIAFLATLGLQHIHERGLVHRDLKPANIMLCPAPAAEENTLRSSVKILDIGLARPLYDPCVFAISEGLTSEATILGTPAYLAPEQARDARLADIRADIYSLGCTLYEMLAGQSPFQDDILVRQLLRHANEEPKPLHEVNRAIPPALSHAVARMLAKDPAERYATPAEAGVALQSLLASKPDRNTAAKARVP